MANQEFATLCKSSHRATIACKCDHFDVTSFVFGEFLNIFMGYMVAYGTEGYWFESSRVYWL
jgi:hypothetical protein